MTIFTRRRIQKMLDEIDPVLDPKKRADLVSRLNNKRVEQALPAEMELALTWAVKDFDHVEVEPEWCVDRKRPDLYVKGLVGQEPAVVEIAATNDNSISGEDAMDRCSQEIINFANSVVKGSGEFLYFGFAETRQIGGGHGIRGIAAPKNYQMSELAKDKVRQWLESKDPENSRLTLSDNGLQVAIERKPNRQIRYHNFWTSRPPRTYSETNNPIYELLRKKLAQVEGAPHGTKRIIFLSDVGSRTLVDINERFSSPGIENHATATKIIHRFLADKRGRIDAVVVFSPEQRPINFWDRREAGWSTTVFSESPQDALVSGLKSVQDRLPSPRFSGPQARSIFRQRAFDHDALGWYLETKMTTSNNDVKYQFSVRALQDFLARRISEEQFRNFIGDREDGPSFARFLDQGLTISTAQILSAGDDEDDDYIEFGFSSDPAAKQFE